MGRLGQRGSARLISGAIWGNEMKVCSAILLAFLAVLVLANGIGAKDKERALQVSDFGKTKDGTVIQRYVLSNKKNFEAVVTNYGASLVSVKSSGSQRQNCGRGFRLRRPRRIRTG